MKKQGRERHVETDWLDAADYNGLRRHH